MRSARRPFAQGALDRSRGSNRADVARQVKRLTGALSTGVVAGFIVGITVSLHFVAANRYVQYKMFRSLTVSLREFLNRWVALFAAISLVILVLQLLVSFAAKLTRRRSQSARTEAEDHARNPERPLKVHLVLLVCCTFFFWGGWAINHYWLPHKFHPISLLIDFGILLLMVLLGRALLRLRWENALKVLPGTALILVALLLVLNASIVIDAKANAARGPNILLLLVDCLRPDHLGCYGYSRNTSPYIDKLAQEGVIFADAYSNAPWTKPSVASFLTSLYPNVHGAVNITDTLPHGVLTIAELLKDRGYYTCFLNGGNVFLDTNSNFDQGFDLYRFYDHRLKGTSVTDGFLSLVPKLEKRAFFAYLHYMDVHVPYHENQHNGLFTDKVDSCFEPGGTSCKCQAVRQLTAQPDGVSDEDKEHLMSLYDGQIRFVDENIRKVVSSLEDHDILKDTLIIVTSDHGEELWEHDNFEHGHTLYNELLRVPLIMTGNGLKHSEVAATVRLLDLAPTILGLAAVEVGGAPAQGSSLPNILKGEDPESELPIFAMGTFYGDEKYCLVKGNNKLILNTRNGEAKAELTGYRSPDEFELYNLDNDPLEKHNLKDSSVEALSALEKELAEFMDVESLFRSGRATVDKQSRDRLRSLGYLK